VRTLLKILGVLAGIVVAAIVIVLVVADVKYEAIRPSPVVSHENAVTPETRIRLVFEPSRAGDFIASRVEAAGLPPGAAEYAMPREVALFVQHDDTMATVPISVFANTPRFAPVIAEQATAAMLQQSVPQIAWREPGLKAIERGVLIGNGALELDQQDVMLLDELWGRVTGVTSLAVPEGHLIAGSVENRDGSLYLLISALRRAGLIPPEVPLTDVAKSLIPVGQVTLYADLAGNDTLDIHFEIEGTAIADERAMGTLDFMLGVVLSGLGNELKEAHGVVFAGDRRIQDLVIIGDYKLGNFTPLLPF
jgi:hypothetical protein